METAVELRERARKCYEAARSGAQLAEDIEEFQRILGASNSKTVDNTAESIKNDEAT